MFKIKLEGGKTMEVEESTYWHTTAHILAQAAKRLYSTVKLTIGPSIENGFYYDFDVETPFTEEDIEALEEEMRKIIKEDLKIERFELSREEAIKLMKEKDEPYKIELINGLPEGEVISFYKQGEFVDLCRGPHLQSTGKVKSFKLTAKSSAYWRGDSKNKSLQRIYGISFPKTSELEEYLKKLEEAKQRDHRKLGKELSIFMTHDLVGKGLPMYLPNGYVVWEILENYIKGKEKKLDYKHVLTPPLASVNLYKTSGHWEHYKDNMFPKMEVEGEEFVLRPMNCPHHMMIYKNFLHSYKDLPIRIAEIANDFRYESSGACCGIERTRAFTQNDSHIFCTPEEIKSEIKGVIALILDVYKDFGFNNYEFRLSLRDSENTEKYFGNDELWEKSEKALREVLTELNVPFYEALGEAAFYGPKIDVQVKSAIGHDVTLSTVQVDYQLPERFELEYVNDKGEKERPIVIHRAILGSLDRFTAFLLEECKGYLPLWLAPNQINIIPVNNEYHLEYAKEIYELLSNEGFKVLLDDRNEKLGYKIRESIMKKYPYTLILGQKEVDNKNISFRRSQSEETITLSKEEFIKMLHDEIACKGIK